MTAETFNLIAAICLVVLTAAVLGIAWAVIRSGAEARRLMAELHEEVPRTLRQASATAASVESLTADLASRVERLDRLADEAEETLVALRATIAAADSIVRGPADVMDGAKRTAESMGKGLLSGADRLRRRIAGEDDAPT
ncbi:MAG: DUF948 domain-containing protein [Chloroflexi bacterium]|nr:DUF948 domain-containing protein [Chloroflexota bacterium]MDQ3407946.1 DUF948 domain-containing protein [Chloroflexota bacterium]